MWVVKTVPFRVAKDVVFSQSLQLVLYGRVTKDSWKVSWWMGNMSPPRIRSRDNRWKFALFSVVRNASSAADGDVPVAISMQITLFGTKEK